MNNYTEVTYAVASGYGEDIEFLRKAELGYAYTEDLKEAVLLSKEEAEKTKIDDEYVLEVLLDEEGTPVAFKDTYKAVERESLQGINVAWGKVKQMHQSFGHPVSDTPVMLSAERLATRFNWVREELQEATDATTLVDQVDGHIDAIYFLIGNLVEMGVRPQALFDIVQDANMGKLWEDGKPRFHPDGKIKKPDGWLETYKPEPLIAEELDRQRIAHVNHLLGSEWTRV